MLLVPNTCGMYRQTAMGEMGQCREGGTEGGQRGPSLHGERRPRSCLGSLSGSLLPVEPDDHSNCPTP